MNTLFKPSSKLLAMFVFLPITPSIAAITVFTQSLLIDKNQEVSFVSEDAKRIIDASRN
tara:strand:+ start:74 stop:250 length:177 start_codon:yes stop_codon:yes gene_type:complete